MQASFDGIYKVSHIVSIQVFRSQRSLNALAYMSGLLSTHKVSLMIKEMIRCGSVKEETHSFVLSVSKDVLYALCP
jgi:hypothetical protein